MRILEADDKLAMELALVENLQREDLNPMEEAAGYKKLMDDYGLTQEQVASRVQKSRPAVTNALRLLSLGETLQKKVSSGKLSAGHARALLPLKTETLREKAAAEVESRGLSVRQTETLVASLLRQAEQPEKEEKKLPVVDYVREAEKALSDALGRGVKFQGGQKKGRHRAGVLFRGRPRGADGSAQAHGQALEKEIKLRRIYHAGHSFYS